MKLPVGVDLLPRLERWRKERDAKRAERAFCIAVDLIGIAWALVVTIITAAIWWTR